MKCCTANIMKDSWNVMFMEKAIICYNFHVLDDDDVMLINM